MGHGGTECEIHERRNDRVNEGRERKDDGRPSERVSKSEPRNHLNQGMNIHPCIVTLRSSPLPSLVSSNAQGEVSLSVCQSMGWPRPHSSIRSTHHDGSFCGDWVEGKSSKRKCRTSTFFLLLSIQPAGQASHTRSHMRTQLKPKTLRPQSSH